MQHEMGVTRFDQPNLRKTSSSKEMSLTGIDHPQFYAKHFPQYLPLLWKPYSCSDLSLLSIVIVIVKENTF